MTVDWKAALALADELVSSEVKRLVELPVKKNQNPPTVKVNAKAAYNLALAFIELEERGKWPATEEL